jgi:Uma2 family endonuclease
MSTVIYETPSVQTIPQEIYYPESDGEPMAETDVHRDHISDAIDSLRLHFQDEDDVYVSGNIMFYYVEGDPKKVISPDVMVVRGVEKKQRRIYKLWLEGKPPEVVFEFSSRKTWNDDLIVKLRRYEEMGVKEYYVFDPEYDYLPDPLLAFRLIDGRLVQVEVKDGRIFSEALGLEIVDTGKGLRFFNPKTGQFLRTYLEAENMLHEQEIALQKQETALKEKDAEIARLRAELEKRDKQS